MISKMQAYKLVFEALVLSCINDRNKIVLKPEIPAFVALTSKPQSWNPGRPVYGDRIQRLATHEALGLRAGTMEIQLMETIFVYKGSVIKYSANTEICFYHNVFHPVY